MAYLIVISENLWNVRGVLFPIYTYKHIYIAGIWIDFKIYWNINNDGIWIDITYIEMYDNWFNNLVVYKIVEGWFNTEKIIMLLVSIRVAKFKQMACDGLIINFDFLVQIIKKLKWEDYTFTRV